MYYIDRSLRYDEIGWYQSHTEMAYILTWNQRYEIVLEANQAIDDYWIRAMYQVSVFPMAQPNNTLGILRYEGADGNAGSVSENYLMSSIYATHANGPVYVDVLEPWVNTEIGTPAVEMEIQWIPTLLRSSSSLTMYVTTFHEPILRVLRQR